MRTAEALTGGHWARSIAGERSHERTRELPYAKSVRMETTPASAPTRNRGLTHPSSQTRRGL